MPPPIEQSLGVTRGELIGRVSSRDGPGVAAADERGEPVAGLAGCGVAGGGDLAAGAVVVRRPLDLAEDPDRRLVEVAGVGEPRDRERRGRVGVVRVVDQDRVLADVGDLDDLDATGLGVADQALGARRRAPNRIGSPCTSGMIASALVSLFLIASNAPSLKIGQFW